MAVDLLSAANRGDFIKPASVILFLLILLYAFACSERPCDDQGKQFPNLVWAAMISGAIFFIFIPVSYKLIRYLISNDQCIARRRVLKTVFTSLWMILSFILFLVAACSVNGPVPVNGSSSVSAIGSLRATSSDLATLMIEYANPVYLSEELSSQIDSVQIGISEDFSWGLGMGIQHTACGDAIWQNAITTAFRGVMVIYPREGWGVVVLTNSRSGLPVAYDVAERAPGGEAKWKYF